MAALELALANEAQVAEWLVNHKFSKSQTEVLEGYTGIDLVELSRQDLKEILGTAAGIRLFNHINREMRQSQSENKEETQKPAGVRIVDLMDNDEDGGGGGGDDAGIPNDDSDVEEPVEPRTGRSESVAQQLDSKKSNFSKEALFRDMPGTNALVDGHEFDCYLIENSQWPAETTTAGAKTALGRLRAIRAKVTTRRGPEPVKAATKLRLFVNFDSTGHPFGSIYWYKMPRSDVTDSHALHMEEVREVLVGAHAKFFVVAPEVAATMDEGVRARCFTLVGPKYTLNLVAPSPNVAAVWVNAVRYALLKSGKVLVATDDQTRVTVVHNTSIALPQVEGKAYKSGFMLKLGGVRRNWKERFFQRHGFFLEYFNYQPTERFPFRSAGRIPLLGATVRKVKDSVYLRKNVFSIHPTGLLRTWILEAPSEDACTDWIDFISGVVHEAGGKVVRSGYMGKLGHKLNLNTFRNRFFVLSDTGLRYYKKKGDVLPLGEISIQKGGTLALEDCFTRGEVQYHAFSLTPHGANRKWLLATTSDELKQEWLVALRNVLDINAIVSTKAGSVGEVLDVSGRPASKAELMYKMGASNKISSLRERFFALFPDKLVYFRARGDRSRAIGVVMLTGGALLNDEADFKVGAALYYAFSLVVSGSRRRYVMACHTREAKKSWMDALGIVLRKLPDYAPAPALTPSAEQLKQGYIFKLGSKCNLASMTHRHFVLTNTFLRYYKKAGAPNAAGEIPLASGAYLGEKEEVVHRNVTYFNFAIQPATQGGARKFVLCCTSDAMRQEWMEAINRVLMGEGRVSDEEEEEEVKNDV